MRLVDADLIEKQFDPDTWQGEMMIAIARGLPTVNEWISYSERPPENEGHYLVSLKHKEFDETDVDLLHYDDDEGFWFHDNTQKIWWEVIAWKRLPEAYKNNIK